MNTLAKTLLALGLIWTGPAWAQCQITSTAKVTKPPQTAELVNHTKTIEKFNEDIRVCTVSAVVRSGGSEKTVSSSMAFSVDQAERTACQAALSKALEKAASDSTPEVIQVEQVQTCKEIAVEPGTCMWYTRKIKIDAGEIEAKGLTCYINGHWIKKRN